MRPQLATAVTAPPAGSGWIYESKLDGYRILARIAGDDVRLFTRNGHDWTARMGPLRDELARLELSAAWLDGEIVVLDARGRPDFQRLQRAFDDASADDIVYFAFDLLHLDGHDLRRVPLVERRELLRELLLVRRPGEHLRFSETLTGPAQRLLASACEQGLEGIIGKRADSLYTSSRSPAWIKLKCTLRQEFVVGGYTEPKGSRTGFGGLLLGVHDDDGQLVYAGSVGTGFDDKALRTIFTRLRALAVDRSPFHDRPRDVKGHWVRPALVAEVSFSEWTSDGRVRHPVFHGLRTDKDPATIVRERPQASPSGRARTPARGAAVAARASSERGQARASAGPPDVAPRASSERGRARASAGSPGTVAARATSERARARVSAGPSGAANARATADSPRAPAIKVTHPERIVDAQSGATKLDLVRYYESVAAAMLPHLAARPLSLVRAPTGVAGEQFFQKHGETGSLPGFRPLAARRPGRPAPLEIASADSLVAAAQMNVIEFHTGNASAPDLERPDRVIFDLDPGEGVPWTVMQDAARLTKAILELLGLRGFLKTSGGKGLHVVVPLRPTWSFDQVKDFSRAVAEHLAATLPALFVAKSGARNRRGRIFVDYLRNGQTATTVAAFSARARPGLGVSVPLAWTELDKLTAGDQWNIFNVPARLDALRKDPWAGYGNDQTLDAAAERLAGSSR
ncbi:DNA ligase D [Nannocystis bainbridge]|uniref:DNA ligase (ATP) n=1 Tax=Nannocystis bainbridge TaxID=2995303 RepID=A0ABT5DSI2_9BACT|nr:DNA ligase D [Nannocystis bainbridge]MDC0716595.1 DNA ligase D [Nannocystis bainbridge]